MKLLKLLVLCCALVVENKASDRGQVLKEQSRRIREWWAEGAAFSHKLALAVQTDNVVTVQRVWNEDSEQVVRGKSHLLSERGSIGKTRVVLASLQCKNPLVVQQLQRWGLPTQELVKQEVFKSDGEPKGLHKDILAALHKPTAKYDHALQAAVASNDLQKVRDAWGDFPDSYKRQVCTLDRCVVWKALAECNNPLIVHQLKKWGLLDPHALYGEQQTNSIMDLVLLTGENNRWDVKYHIYKLWKMGVSLDTQRPIDGKTALLLALKADNFEAAIALLERGADKEIKDIDGKTPLIHAAQMGNVGVAWNLLERRADTTVKDSSGNTALDYAHQWGAKEDEKCKERGNALIFLLTKYGVKI